MEVISSWDLYCWGKFYPSKKEICFIMHKWHYTSLVLQRSFFATYLFFKDKECALTFLEVTLWLLVLYDLIIAKATWTKNSHLLWQLGFLDSSIELHQQRNACCPLCSLALVKFHSMVKSQLTSHFLCEAFSIPLRTKLLHSQSKFSYSTKSSLLLWIIVYVFLVLLPSKLNSFNKVTFLFLQ